jgi:hypothetical protein
MSNKKARAARREGRRGGSTKSPFRLDGQQTELSSRLKAIGLRVLLMAVFMAISGFGLSAFWNYTHPPKPLHAFSAKERSAFIDSLKARGVPTQSVWLACPDGETDTCRLVKQFVTMFQESGWRVEGSQVVQWKPAHPLGGVYLILQAAGEPDESTKVYATGLKNSFTTLGIPVRSASAPDVPKNSIGIYFGPDL